MLTLIHYPLCPFSRSIRLALSELELDVELVEEKPWEWRQEFLRVNPAGNLPVLVIDDEMLLCGYYVISEYLSENMDKILDSKPGFSLLPESNSTMRAETRRIIDWFHNKFYNEISGFLSERQNWLAGTDMSYADLSAAAHLSVIDYLGDVAWDEYPAAKHWYARVKSRPSFRALLSEKIPGVPPAHVYANLDF